MEAFIKSICMACIQGWVNRLLTDAKLLELIYSAAMCYVPSEDLTEDQLWRFDNIRYRWCRCHGCKKALSLGDKVIIPQNAGHADQRTWEIFLSRPLFKKNIDMPNTLFLLNWIKTTLHEIVHVLFPQFDENQTFNKTWEWLRKNEWVAHAEEFERTARAQFEEECKSA